MRRSHPNGIWGVGYIVYRMESEKSAWWGMKDRREKRGKWEFVLSDFNGETELIIRC